jgi:hypothetical protein
LNNKVYELYSNPKLYTTQTIIQEMKRSGKYHSVSPPVTFQFNYSLQGLNQYWQRQSSSLSYNTNLAIGITPEIRISKEPGKYLKLYLTTHYESISYTLNDEYKYRVLPSYVSTSIDSSSFLLNKSRGIGLYFKNLKVGVRSQLFFENNTFIGLEYGWLNLLSSSVRFMENDHEEKYLPTEFTKIKKERFTDIATQSGDRYENYYLSLNAGIISNKKEASNGLFFNIGVTLYRQHLAIKGNYQILKSNTSRIPIRGYLGNEFNLAFHLGAGIAF